MLKSKKIKKTKKTKISTIRPIRMPSPYTYADPKFNSPLTMAVFPGKTGNKPEATTFSIETLKQQVSDLAKPNLFRVRFEINSNSLPPELSAAVLQNLEVYVKSAAFPSRDVGRITIIRSGSTLKIPGDVKYSDVTVTFNADVDQEVRMAFHTWHRLFVYNEYDCIGSAEPLLPNKGKVTIEQLDPSYNITYAIVLMQAWPAQISEIQLSHDSEHAREEFSVTFAYTWFDVLKDRRKDE